MKVEYRADVQSTAEKLWDILTDLHAWPEAQGMVCVEAPGGPIVAGSRFVANSGGLSWNMVITEAERPVRLAWVGRRPGLTAMHEWEFEETSGRTHVLNREQMSGWMAALLYPVVKKGLTNTNEKWLASLKSRAESL